MIVPPEYDDCADKQRQRTAATPQKARLTLSMLLDGEVHLIDDPPFPYAVKLTNLNKDSELPPKLDDWAEKISSFIAIGRECGCTEFEEDSIARFICYGNPEAHESKEGHKYLKKIQAGEARQIDEFIEFLTNVKAERVDYFLHITKKGSETIATTITSKLLESLKETTTYDSRVFWHCPSASSDVSPQINYTPLLYTINQDLNHNASNPSSDIVERDNMLRKYFEAKRERSLEESK